MLHGRMDEWMLNDTFTLWLCLSSVFRSNEPQHSIYYLQHLTFNLDTTKTFWCLENFSLVGEVVLCDFRGSRAQFKFGVVEFGRVLGS